MEVRTMEAQDFKMLLRQTPVTLRVAKDAGLVTSAGYPAPASPPMRQAPAQSTTGQDVEFKEMSVPDTASTVGCLFTSVPPGRVFIKKVDGGSWAGQQGIQVGWELFSLNGEPCEEMKADTFRTSMRARPLRLEFKIEAGRMAAQLPSTRKDIIKELFKVVA